MTISIESVQKSMSGKDRTVDDDEEAAGDACEETGDHQRGQLVPPHVHADHLAPDGVVAYRLEDAAERRLQYPVIAYMQTRVTMSVK